MLRKDFTKPGSEQDANGVAAMRPKEVSDRLQLEKIAKDHVWKVEPSCATTGEGIFEGLVRTSQALGAGIR